MKSSRQHNAFTYRMELLFIKVRDLVRSPIKILRDAGVVHDMVIVDFGCGPGGFALAAARLVGPRGKVFAVDVQPLALETVQRLAVRKHLGNIMLIRGGHEGEVPSESADMALLYDVLHACPGREASMPILSDVHRILKKDGVLSIRDHHLCEADLLSMLDDVGLFRLAGRSRWALQFAKVVGK